jgi:hypothetical protein
MRNCLPEKLEAGRVTSGPLGGDHSWGCYGAFFVQGPCGEMLAIVASGGDADDQMSEGWEHVSVSTRRRNPNWQEMCFVKDLFWDETETVIQFHPPRSEYVNNHNFCLHLWRHKEGHRLPPSILVGLKSRGLMSESEAHVVRRQMGLT